MNKNYNKPFTNIRVIKKLSEPIGSLTERMRELQYKMELYGGGDIHKRNDK